MEEEAPLAAAHSAVAGRRFDVNVGVGIGRRHADVRRKLKEQVLRLLVRGRLAHRVQVLRARAPVPRDPAFGPGPQKSIRGERRDLATTQRVSRRRQVRSFPASGVKMSPRIEVRTKFQLCRKLSHHGAMDSTQPGLIPAIGKSKIAIFRWFFLPLGISWKEKKEMEPDTRHVI